MTRIPDSLAALGTVALLVWLLALAGALSLSATVDWVVFGIGLGLMVAARVARGGAPAEAQRPL